MTGLKAIAFKFFLFALSSVLLFVLLLNTMLNGLGADSDTFSAEFEDVSGLRVGDDVKVAGVRVGRVTAVEVTDAGAQVDFELSKEQPILDNTLLVMRYQNLLGQRYLAMVQGEQRGDEMSPGQTIPVERTDPGFDLTELLNGFRPLFEVLQPADVNQLAESMIKVLQGESGTVEQLLQQTTELTNFVADRDQLYGEVVTNLVPVLDNLAGRGTEIKTTVRELRSLMTGLARDRKSIGNSIDGVSRLVGSTSQLLRDIRVPTVRTVDELLEVSRILATTRNELNTAMIGFGQLFGGLARIGQYENALNVYACSAAIALGSLSIYPVGNDGPFSEVCL